MAQDISTPLGRTLAYLQMQFEDHGLVRSAYNNFFALPGGMYRCSQPSPGQIRKYHRKYGIRTIINLRGENPYGSYVLEREVCEELGIEMIDHNLYSRDMPSVDEVVGTRELLERIAYPALMHCKSGADRAGLGATLYRHFRLGEPICQVRELHWKYGHFTIARTGILDYFIAAYCAYNAKQPIAFIDWVTTVYDQQALTAEYEARGLGSRFGNWLVDKVLDRE